MYTIFVLSMGTGPKISNTNQAVPCTATLECGHANISSLSMNDLKLKKSYAAALGQQQ